MAVVRWEPFRELSALQSELSRFMNQVWSTADAGGGSAASTWLPPLDVWESEDEIVLALDLPGLSEEDVTIEIDEGTLTVSGTRERAAEQSSERFYRFERRHGAFTRSVTLPAGVDESKIRADFAKGVLEVHVAKPEERRPKRIEIGAQRSIEGEAERVDG